MPLSRGGVGAAFALGAVLWLGGQDAAAAEPERPLSNALSGRSGGLCLRPEALVARVSRWLGRETIDARLAIVLEVDEGDPTRVSFVVRRGSETIAVRGWDQLRGSCDEMLEAVSISMALAIDNTVFERLGRAQAPPPPPKPFDTWSLAAGGFYALNVLPATTMGLRLGIELQALSALRVRVGASGLSQREVPLYTGGAQVSLWAGDLDACLVQRSGMVLPAICAGVSAGRLRGEGVRFENGFSKSLLWMAAAARAELRVRLGRVVALTAGGAALVSFGDRALDVEDVEGRVLASRDVPRYGATVDLGLAVYFR